MRRDPKVWKGWWGRKETSRSPFAVSSTDDLWPSELGNKLLVYISGCLGGRSYVTGEALDEQIAPSVQAMAFDFLMTSQTPKGEAFPHLTTLLLFNTKDFLNVLALAFDEPPLRGEKG